MTNRLTGFAFLLLATASLWAQAPAPPPSAAQGQPAPAAPRGSSVIRGSVKDDSGAIIPRASVTITDSNGRTQTATSQADGTFVFRSLAAGTYSVSAAFTNLQPKSALLVSVSPGQPATANIVMTVQEQKQEVTVTDNVTNQVSTDAANNSSQLVLKQEDLDALPDDPDDLQADLQALAGPSAGPGGTQIYIDGFTGGRLPPKASIREIRINSNPFSAEFDKLGFGRIQIFTKPGTDKFHGQGYYDISDDIWNSRNPFLTVNPPFRTQLFGGNLSGPLGPHASFFVDVERRNIDDNGIFTASVPTTDFLNSLSYQGFYPTPQRRTTISPRVDYQLGTNNTLSFRYSYLENDHLLTNIGGFDLPQTTVTDSALGNVTYQSNGYKQSSTEQTAQMVETSVLSTHVVNETHFEFDRTNQTTTSASTAPELNVGQSFVTGGSGYSSPSFAAGTGYGTTAYPSSYDLQNYYELQNYTTVTWGAHTTKFGVRIRTTVLDDLTPENYNGIYSFQGGVFPLLNGYSSLCESNSPAGECRLTSISQYLITEQLFNAGLTSAEIHSSGYGPSKFQIDAGNPYVGFYQIDAGPFVQDDWRVRPNLTLSLGLRWEAQNNVADHNDWAPRVGIAWAPGRNKPDLKPQLVVRAGWGIFYDRFAIANVENAYRSQIVNQYVVDNPTAFDAAFNTVPSLSALSTDTGESQRYEIDPTLKIPRLMQTIVGIDRQLFSHTTLSVNFMNSRGVHELLTDDINAPIPSLGDLPPGSGISEGQSLDNTIVGVRPYPGTDLYDYQSTGIFKQTQINFSVNSQIGKRITLHSHYVYTQAHSDTDGITSMPADPYNIAADYGRSSLDVHNQLFIGGSISAPWGLRFSPFIVAHSGTPFNITTGTDLYGTGTLDPTARPEPVTCTPGATVYAYIGCLNADPVVGAPLVERNSATGPGFLGINLRVSKTFGFGTTHFEGPSGGARSGGGGFGGGGRGGFGGPGGFGGDSSEHRYNLTVSVGARNILNHENLNTPNGAITSPYYGESTGITGGFGAEATASNQRRIDIQLRFAF